jgi:hypothetical protein
MIDRPSGWATARRARVRSRLRNDHVQCGYSRCPTEGWSGVVLAVAQRVCAAPKRTGVPCRRACYRAGEVEAVGSMAVLVGPLDQAVFDALQMRLSAFPVRELGMGVSRLSCSIFAPQRINASTTLRCGPLCARLQRALTKTAPARSGSAVDQGSVCWVVASVPRWLVRSQHAEHAAHVDCAERIPA